MPLTEIAVRNAKPKDKPYRLADEKGMYLEVHANGRKYWRQKYRIEGKEKRLALGVYPEVSLADARRKRDEARKLIAEGTDPGEVRKAAKDEAALADGRTFEAVARAWHTDRSHDLVQDYADKIIRSLEVDVFPEIGSMDIAAIKPPRILALLRKIEARGALETVKRVRQRIADVFTYAIVSGLRESENPVVGLEKAMKKAPVKHRASLHASELKPFFIRLEAARISQPIRLALRLLVLLFLRPGELRAAQWQEIDLDAAVWTIPAERDRSRGMVGMKMKEAHTVPLPHQAVAIFRQLQAYSGSGELVFPNRNDPRRPVSDGTLNSALRALGYSGEQVSGHGFRATAASALAEMGFRKEVIDRQLSHRERNQVLAAYVHHAEYLSERKAMLQQWADYLESLESDEKIIPILRSA